jgi:Holliday junction resolvase RusA-like endonuclease
MCDSRVLTARLPHPVSINRMYKTTRTGQFYVDPRVKLWKLEAARHCLLAGWKPLPPQTALAVELTLYTHRHDVDAGIKATLDLIQSVLGVDDRYVTRLLATRVQVAKEAEHLDVAVTTLD